MITKEKIKIEIDKLTETEVEKVYLYLTSLIKTKRPDLNIPALNLGGKLDKEDLRSLAYE